MISVVSRNVMTSVSSVCAGNDKPRAGVTCSGSVGQMGWHANGAGHMGNGGCGHRAAARCCQPYLDEGPDDPEAGQPQVLERPVLAVGVQERVEVQRHVRCKDHRKRQSEGEGFNERFPSPLRPDSATRLQEREPR